MTELEHKLGFEFQNRSYLRTALTHSSYANENKSSGECNERLEFLGDAVLGVCVAEYLYAEFPDMPEGKMTRLRADMVCEKNLAALAVRLSLGEHLYLGHGETLGGGRERPSILADAVEAVIAAIYLDGGMENARVFIEKNIIAPFKRGDNAVGDDYKTRLQELVQRTPGHDLCYVHVGAEGPDHAKLFTAEVRLDGAAVASGTGRSKKEAEQAAARSALENLL